MPASGVFLALFLAFAPAARAGFFSFLGNLFGSGQSNASSYNSQNLPLLKAPSAADPKAATGGAVMNIVEDSSLFPVIGPMGSLADFETYKLDQITTYTVQPEDNLSKIAKMFNRSVSDIYWANNLKNGDLVKAGDTLIIFPISGFPYTVKKEDTAQSLAKKFKSDAQEIINANSEFNLPANGPLEEGITIIIPDIEIEVPQYAPVRGSGSPSLPGYFMRPIVGGRNSRATASNPHGYHGYNNSGVDLAASCLTPVYASAGGTVIVARNQGWNGGYGKYVVIAHSNGTQTVYAHLSYVIVKVGDHVEQGQQIGSIGSTGNSSGCHVHFEIRGAAQIY
ncbi:MAG: M23 family metallopeptidase [Candidatus Giovannonibacteria bacterium]|nr:M23 family metallopeptidase [Candidatus Giovannonibacteria bacterium]